MKLTNKMLLICLVTLFLAPFVSADFYYESEISGQPGVDGVRNAKNYISEDGMRVEAGDGNILIVNFKDAVMYKIDTAKKEYVETKFEDLMKPLDAKNQEMADQMAKMVEQMMSSIEVNKTEEKQKINGWDCIKYNLTIMGQPSEYWISKDVKNYTDLGNYINKYKKVFEKSPMLKGISAGFEMQKKLDGFPIKTINKMMGMEVISTVTKIENTKIDTKYFLPAKDFKKVADKK